MRRREFITGIAGTTVAWPPAASAQQPAMPLVGFLHIISPGTDEAVMAAFRNGLREAGYTEHRNVVIEYRWAEAQFDRLPALALTQPEEFDRHPGCKRRTDGGSRARAAVASTRSR
jgi:putative tryptophan/tyrosine transport system substrate-binding protein